MPRGRARFLLPLAILAAASLPSSLSAQACLGNPSFSVNHLQVAAGAAFDEGATSFTGNFVGGSETLFTGISLGGATYDGISGASFLAGVSGGFQVPLSSGSAQICPVLGAQFGFGPADFDGSGTNFRSQAYNFGLAAGGELFRSERVAVIPSFSLGFVYTAATTTGLLTSGTETDTYGIAGAALGLVLSDRLSVRPSISMPLGLDGAEPVFGIGFALNYGGRR